MASVTTLPFNFQPTSTQQGTTGTYTVPTGKYALVTLEISLGFSFAVTPATSGGVISNVLLQSPSQSLTIPIWLYEGQTLVLANSSTTATISTSGTAIVWGEATATAGVGITIGGVLWKAPQLRGIITADIGTVSVGLSTITLTPSNSFGWFAQEFNQLT